MLIKSIEINNFRNIEYASLKFCSGINLLFGENGSGKTSFLEAIHYLALGRSFRSRNLTRIIRHDSNSFSLISQLYNKTKLLSLGLERQKEGGDLTLRIGGQPAHSLAEVARLIPLQLLNADSHALIGSGPLIRRQFLDWGTFHVEHTFHYTWQRVNRLLKQRNAALKTAHSYKDIEAWDKELVEAALTLDNHRQAYFSLLNPQFESIIQTLLPDSNLQLQYFPGWGAQKDLVECLALNFNKDRQLGYSQQGPQRADLRLKIDNFAASEILSQGQQKMAAYALRLAQGQAFESYTGKRCIFLIDDLASELDVRNRKLITDILSDLGSQIFVTCIEPSQLSDLEQGKETAMFHVEHGNIASINRQLHDA